MNFKKISAVIIIISCLSVPLFNFNTVNCTTISGDWIVTGNELIKDTTITLDGNLIIQSGGNLTLNNVILRVSSTSTKQYSILAKSNSFFSLINSKIVPTDERYGPILNLNGAEFTIKNSEILFTKYENSITDCFVLRDIKDSIIENSTITFIGGSVGCDSSVNFQGISDMTIKNSVFNSTGKVHLTIMLDYSNNTLLISNKFVTAALELQNAWNTTITKNDFIVKPACGGSVGLMIDAGCGNNLIDGNTFSVDEGNEAACTAFRLLGNWFPNTFVNNVIIGIRYPNQIGFLTDILISKSSNAIIANNTIIDKPNSTSIGAGQGNEAIQISWSDNLKILNNLIVSENIGITTFSSTNNTIQGNKISYCGQGLGFYYSSDSNFIKENELKNNLINIVLDDSNSNSISNNAFIESGRQGYDDSKNVYSQNYWSDYLGKNRGDGIGITPYYIPYTGVDNSPLIEKPIFSLIGIPIAKIAPYESLYPEGYSFTDLKIEILNQTTIRDRTITIFEGINIYAGASLTLENVTVLEAPFTGVMRYSIRAWPGSTLIINNCSFIGAGKGPGLFIEASNTQNLRVTNCRFYDTGSPSTQTGPVIGLTNTTNSVITNNSFTRSKVAISINSGSNIHIINNTITKSFFGIAISDWNNSVCSGNLISESIHVGLQSVGSTGCKIVNNTIADAWGGISWDSSIERTLPYGNNDFSGNRIINYNGILDTNWFDIGNLQVNRALNANFSVTSPSTVNQPLIFDASASSPGNGSIVSYQWDFGDNTTATGQKTTHSYSATGNYIMGLNVTNTEGRWYMKTQSITVQAAPIPTPTPTPSPTTPPTTSPTTSPTTQPTANPTTEPTQTPTNTPSPSPTVPEFPAVAMITLLTAILLIVGVVKLKKKSLAQ